MEAGLNDCEISRRLAVPRATIRDWRRPRYVANERMTCPRCWRLGRPLTIGEDDYAELLGLYLGDGHITRLARTSRLRLFLDSRHAGVVERSAALLARCFTKCVIGRSLAHGGSMTILRVHHGHLGCLLPQHGAGLKRLRRIELEDWQRSIVRCEPWRFLRGCINSDGCVFVNRTGPYRYLSYDFCNFSPDILDLFGDACATVGVEHRRYEQRIRIYRRTSVALMQANVGTKG